MPKGVYQHKSSQGFQKGNIPWSKGKIGSNSPRWKGGKKKKNCLTCNKKIQIEPSRIKNGNGKFCSRECYGVWRSKNIRKEKCSSWKGGKIKIKCEICGKEKLIYPCRIKRSKIISCSIKCMGILYSKILKNKNNPNWINGKSFEPYPISWTENLKESIRKRDNNICQICGKSQIILKRKLSVHHIDYNKKNLDPKNLITLCIKCHLKTNTNREYWRKYFKKYISGRV